MGRVTVTLPMFSPPVLNRFCKVARGHFFSSLQTSFKNIAELSYACHPNFARLSMKHIHVWSPKTKNALFERLKCNKGDIQNTIQLLLPLPESKPASAKGTIGKALRDHFQLLAGWDRKAWFLYSIIIQKMLNLSSWRAGAGNRDF